mmetsp:Transcript_41374/g.109617  ORF Transcript_41374/g.109617 Transcript_41374/m.109617 type:complete len:274 (+) Transcript_41374:702-1523(+)
MTVGSVHVQRAHQAMQPFAKCLHPTWRKEPLQQHHSMFLEGIGCCCEFVRTDAPHTMIVTREHAEGHLHSNVLPIRLVFIRRWVDPRQITRLWSLMHHGFLEVASGYPAVDEALIRLPSKLSNVGVAIFFKQLFGPGTQAGGRSRHGILTVGIGVDSSPDQNLRCHDVCLDGAPQPLRRSAERCVIHSSVAHCMSQCLDMRPILYCGRCAARKRHPLLQEVRGRRVPSFSHEEATSHTQRSQRSNRQCSASKTRIAFHYRGSSEIVPCTSEFM